MIGHMGINVPDLNEARAYYDVVLPLVGFESYFGDDTQQAYRPANGKPGTYLFLYETEDRSEGYSRRRTGLQHLAFMVRTRAGVREVAAAVAALGGEIIHAPREFPEYPAPYYATFWIDPHGFMLEAVCHYDRE